VTAPLSYDRVLSALRYLFPWETTITRPAGVAPAVGDTKIGRELGTLAWVAARANDRVEAVLAEIFPDTSDESLARWEFITRTATNESLTLAARRSRVLSVLRRSGGVQLDRLAAMLYGVLGLSSPDDVQFQETTRMQIDAGLTIESDILNFAIPAGGSPLVVGLSAPFPGFIDEYGVQIYVEVSGVGVPAPTFTFTSPDGNGGLVIPTETASYHEYRTTLLGERAGGEWKLSLVDASGGKTLTRWAIRVSNDVDSGQIYNFFAYRDMGLAGTPDLLEAQRLFNRSTLGHMSPSVITQEEFLVDDSLVDREPVA
jgi:hypothetical protein